jgi:adenosine deaminase
MGSGVFSLGINWPERESEHFRHLVQGQVVGQYLNSTIRLQLPYRDNFTFNFKGADQEVSRRVVFMYLRQNGQNYNINLAQHCGEDKETESPRPTGCIHEEIQNRLNSGIVSY